MAMVGVIGGGSWGTALAKLLAECGHDVTLWTRNPEVGRTINESRENTIYLPGFELPSSLRATTELKDAVSGKDLLLSVSPSHCVREVMSAASAYIDGTPYIVSASKGVEHDTHLTMAGVLEQAIGKRHAGRISALSGPSFAREVAAQMPTAVTVAAHTQDVSEAVQKIFNHTGYFRVYSSEDLVGVEIGGAVKNVIALAAGVADGLGFGSNTRAALITRGLAETARLAVRLGANPMTLSGLAGMGDLVLTCTGDLSRNRTVGLRLGRGESLQDILDDMQMVAEGVKNTRSVLALATAEGIEMPITEQMYAMLYENKPPREVVSYMMTRGLKPELDRPFAGQR